MADVVRKIDRFARSIFVNDFVDTMWLSPAWEGIY